MTAENSPATFDALLEQHTTLIGQAVVDRTTLMGSIDQLAQVGTQEALANKIGTIVFATAMVEACDQAEQLTTVQPPLEDEQHSIIDTHRQYAQVFIHANGEGGSGPTATKDIKTTDVKK